MMEVSEIGQRLSSTCGNESSGKSEIGRITSLIQLKKTKNGCNAPRRRLHRSIKNGSIQYFFRE